MSEEENTLDGFIKALDDLNKQNTVKITVPSAKKKMKFSLFSVSQHKDLLKSVFEGYSGIIRSSIIFNNILSANCEEEYEFTLADRAYILTQLRKESLGSAYIINDLEYDLNDLPEPQFDFKYKQKIEYKGMEVELVIPTLTRDTAISNRLIAEINNMTDVVKETEAVSTVLTYEIIKFVSKITVGENSFVFNDNNLFESKQVVSNLPLKLNNKIIEAISEFREKDEQNITFNDGTLLEIDASFLSDD